MAILNMFAAVFLVVIHGSQAQNNSTGVTVVMNATIGPTLQTFTLSQLTSTALSESSVVTVVMSSSPAIGSMNKSASYGVSATPSLAKNNTASSTGLKSTPSTTGINKTPSKGVPSPTIVLPSACKKVADYRPSVNLTGEKRLKDFEKFLLSIQIEIESRTCTNRENCCEGEGKTNVTIKIKNCDPVLLHEECTDLAEVCCRAGFLSASFFTIVVVMFFYLVRS